MFNIPWPKAGSVLWVYQTDLENTKKTALQTIQSKLCENNPTAKHYFEAGTHPDFQLLEAEIIKIEAVRALNEWVATKPRLATCKMALIIQAENLNIQAGNALLKTLEEAPVHTQIVLLTQQPSLVLATIRSRCYTIHLKDQATAHLPVTCAGIPGRNTSEDPQSFLKDLFRHLWLMSQQQAQQGSLIHSKAYWSLVDSLLRSQRFLGEGTSLNKELLIGTLSSQYAALLS